MPRGLVIDDERAGGNGNARLGYVYSAPRTRIHCSIRNLDALLVLTLLRVSRARDHEYVNQSCDLIRNLIRIPRKIYSVYFKSYLLIACLGVFRINECYRRAEYKRGRGELDEFEAIIAIDRKKKRRVIYEVINFR